MWFLWTLSTMFTHFPPGGCGTWGVYARTSKLCEKINPAGSDLVSLNTSWRRSGPCVWRRHCACAIAREDSAHAIQNLIGFSCQKPLTSVQFKMASRCSEKPISAPPRFSEVSPTLPLNLFHLIFIWLAIALGSIGRTCVSMLESVPGDIHRKMSRWSGSSNFENIRLMEFMYHVFTRMPGETTIPYNCKLFW